MNGPYNIGSCDDIVACEMNSQYLSISIDSLATFCKSQYLYRIRAKYLTFLEYTLPAIFHEKFEVV